MTATDTTDKTNGSEQATVVYVYGIVPADVEAQPDAQGVGDPPGKIEIVRGDGVAALVSEVQQERPLGTPDDLKAHADVLDGAAAAAPVLPLRFGAVMTDKEAVANELLAAHQDEFRAALDELEGKAQYVVRGRYIEEPLLRQIIEQDPQAAQLAEQIRSTDDEDATRPARMALGEAINNAVTAKREQDTQRVAQELQERGFLVSIREPSHEEDAFNIACLLETAAEGDLTELVDSLSEEWSDLVQIRLLGPMAPYDFVVTADAAS